MYIITIKIEVKMLFIISTECATNININISKIVLN